MKIKRLVIILCIVLLVMFLYLWNKRSDDIDITPLKDFALTCEPCKKELSNSSLRDSGVWCTQPPMPTNKVLYILNNRKVDDEYKKWVLFIYLKLHEKQLVLYNQSFEVRESPFFVKRFNPESELSKAFCEVISEGFVGRKLGPEFLPASKAYEYIKEHNLFPQDTTIQAQMSMIMNLLNQGITPKKLTER